MSNSILTLIIAGATLAYAQQAGVPPEQQQQYENDRQANALRSKYQLSEDAALRTHKNCQAAQQRQTNPNPHDCDQYLNDAEYFRKMAGSVRTPNRLTGSVTEQPLPPPGSTRGLPGGVAAGVVYGVGTNQGRFNENSQTVSQDPVVDSRGLVNNSNREGAWRGYSNNVGRPNIIPLPNRNTPQRTSGVNGSGYRGLPPGYYIPKHRQ